MPASTKFQDCPTPERDHLLAYLTGAELARQEAITEATNEKHALAWKRWQTFLESIGIDGDPFLDSFDPAHRTILLGAFAHAMRTATFSGPKLQKLASSTVRDSISFVCSSFRQNQRPDPSKDGTGNTAFLLSRQLRGYSNADPAEKREKAITVDMVRAIASRTLTEEDKAIGQLVVGAFFFAMRSCEYSKVSGPRRTKLLCLRNIQFYRGRTRLPHSHRYLQQADSVSITFEFQKNDERDVTITHHCSNDITLCPVRSWAAIVKRILNYPGTNADTPVNTVLINGQLKCITGSRIKTKIRSTAASIGEDVLGFKPSELGTHSIRSGAAMAMYLDNVPTYVIMLIGRWSSDAFLRYIRRQVQEFTSGISRRMIKHTSFFHVPHATSHQQSNREDPRTPHSALTFAGLNNIGRSTSSSSQRPSHAIFP